MGAGEFKPLYRIACNYCESNLRFISGNRPDLLKDISDLISDTYDLTPATAASDPNSLFTFALMNLVQPLANYALHSVLDCAPYFTLFSMRLIIESWRPASTPIDGSAILGLKRGYVRLGALRWACSGGVGRAGVRILRSAANTRA